MDLSHLKVGDEVAIGFPADDGKLNHGTRIEKIATVTDKQIVTENGSRFWRIDSAKSRRHGGWSADGSRKSAVPANHEHHRRLKAFRDRIRKQDDDRKAEADARAADPRLSRIDKLGSHELPWDLMTVDELAAIEAIVDAAYQRQPEPRKGAGDGCEGNV